MSGQKRIVQAKMAHKTPKGSALKSALDPKAMQSKLESVTGDEELCK